MRDFSQRVFSGFAGKIGIVSLMAICFALFNLNINAQTLLVNYDFNAATTACTASPTSVATGVTSVYSASETTCTTTSGTVTDSQAFTQNTTAGITTGFTNSSTTPSKFFQFALSNLPTNLSNYQVYFQSQRSNTGFTTLTLQYSIDGGASFTPAGTQTVSTAFATTTPLVFNLPAAVNNTSSLIIRLVATGATGTTGTIRLDNFQVQALRPTAAMVNVGGRVTDSKGRGISRALVTMTNGNGNRHSTNTDSLGYYLFEEVEVGQTLIFDVQAKRYNFTQPTQVVSLTEEVITVNFTGYTSRRLF